VPQDKRDILKSKEKNNMIFVFILASLACCFLLLPFCLVDNPIKPWLVPEPSARQMMPLLVLEWLKTGAFGLTAGEAIVRRERLKRID
jgi:hypothetical protein